MVRMGTFGSNPA